MSKRPDSSGGSGRPRGNHRRRERRDFDSWRFIGILLAVGFLGLAVILKVIGV